MKRLIMLGTGSAMVTRCYNTCFLIENEQGDLFLTDAGGGNGILRRFDEAKVDFTRLKALFVTHAHTDHILGAIWVMRKIAGMMGSGEYEGDFHIYAHDVAAEYLRFSAKALLKKKDYDQFGKRIFLTELQSEKSIEVLGAELTPFDINSKKAKQFGYCLRDKDGLTLTCLGDEPFCEANIAYAENADWLLCEAFCSYSDCERFKPYEKNHSTVKEASELAERLCAKNLVLYHTEDKTLDTRKIAYTQEAKNYYKGNAFVPDDLDVIPLR